MSETPTEPGDTASGQQIIDRRALSRNGQIRVAGIAVAVTVLAIVGIWAAGRLLATPKSAEGEPSSPPGTFRATPQQLKTLTIEAVAEHGFVSEELTEGKIAVNGDRATPVYSPYSGRVTRVIAGLGDSVKSGAPLATVEASEFVQAQSDLSTAVAQTKIARIIETRKHASFDAKGGSLQDWQQSQADLAAAESNLNSVRNRLKILGKSDAQIAALEAAHAVNAAATIVAPISGTVVDRQVGPGQYVQAAASTPVFTIADPSNVWLLANVREADAGMVHVNDPVEVRVLAYPKRVFNARVTYVAALVDPVTHRIPVRAEIDNGDAALKPEMFASFRILTSAASQAPAVPQAAVVYEGDLAHVWVVAGEGLLAYRAVRVGRTNDGLVEVLDGLKAGEQVVTRGGLFIDQVAVPASS